MMLWGAAVRGMRRRGRASSQLPNVTPNAKCKLRLLKLERIKDYLLIEEEFVANQERLKPADQKIEEDRSKVGPVRVLSQGFSDRERHAATVYRFFFRDSCTAIPQGRGGGLARPAIV